MSIFNITTLTTDPLYTKICNFVDRSDKQKTSTYIDVSTGRLVVKEGENKIVYVYNDLYCIPDAYDNVNEVLDFCTKFF